MTSYIADRIEGCQNFLYQHTINKNKTVGRICALPIAIIDVTLDTVKIPLSLIEHVVKAALSLVAAVFKRKFFVNFQDHSKLAGKQILLLLPKLITFPFDLIFVLISNINHPLEAESINEDHGFFGLLITAIPKCFSANRKQEPLEKEDI